MPIKDGKTATRELREMGINIPIIAVTGNAMSEDIAEFIQSGANELITKPVNEKQLKKILKHYLPPIITVDNTNLTNNSTNTSPIKSSINTNRSSLTKRLSSNLPPFISPRPT